MRQEELWLASLFVRQCVDLPSDLALWLQGVLMDATMALSRNLTYSPTRQLRRDAVFGRMGPPGWDAAGRGLPAGSAGTSAPAVRALPAARASVQRTLRLAVDFASLETSMQPSETSPGVLQSRPTLLVRPTPGWDCPAVAAAPFLASSAAAAAAAASGWALPTTLFQLLHRRSTETTSTRSLSPSRPAPAARNPACSWASPTPNRACLSRPGRCLPALPAPLPRSQHRGSKWSTWRLWTNRCSRGRAPGCARSWRRSGGARRGRVGRSWFCALLPSRSDSCRS